MRIKKHENKNEYLLTKNGLWVRNFLKSMVPYIDINKSIKEKEHFLFLSNEYNNSRSRIPWISSENFYHKKVVIVSDGYGFADKQKLLESLPSDVTIIGVHGTLAKWQASRSMNYYVVNNPFQECMRYLPRNRAMPKCVASIRTNSNFLSAYRGTKYRYVPVSEAGYSGMSYKDADYQIDDYRNPICAALGLAYRFGAEKIVLLCCDDVFSDERPGAEQLHNGLWMYPPQWSAHDLIDGYLHWMRQSPQGTVVVDCSSGPLYANAEYITEDKVLSSMTTEFK